MKMTKKLLALLLCFSMLMQFGIVAYAAGGETNLYAEISATEVEVGDTITLNLYINDMTASGVKAGFNFDNTKLSVDKITWKAIVAYSEDEEDYVENSAVSKATKKQANSSGTALGVYAINNGVDSEIDGDLLVTVTFTAIENGEAKITLREETVGTDAFKSDSVKTITVTVGSSEPEHVCTPGTESYVKGTNGQHTKVVACADNCGKNYSETVEDCSGGKATCEAKAVCQYCGGEYGNKADHKYEFDCSKKCMNCGETTRPDAKCVEKYTGAMELNDEQHTAYYDCAICGQRVRAAEENHYDLDGDSSCDACVYDMSCKHPATKPADNGDGTHSNKCTACGEPVGEPAAHTGGEATCVALAKCDVCGAEYGELSTEHVWGETVTGWYEVNGDYYYGTQKVCGNSAEHVDYTYVTGMQRVPYPTMAINGKTYGPNAEDLNYVPKKGTSKYTDAETAVFVFGADGKFQQTTDIVGGNRYAINGMISWHPGLVQVKGEYYYFVGDPNGGGNIAAQGDVYVTRRNGIAGFEGRVYNFKDGKLSGLNGIVETTRYKETGKYYYQDSQLMLGAGLTKVGDNYIYVRSNGQLAVGKYWVAKTIAPVEVGLYTFDENGYLQTAKDPSVNGLVDGVYYKNGMPYYAGLIEIDGDIYYIRNNGEAATGTYYITKTNGLAGYQKGDKLNFAADGKLVTE